LFRFSVIFIHGLIFIFATLIGLGAKYNIAAREPDETYGVWFTAVAIFNIIVIISAYVQLRLRNIWIFLITAVSLVAFFLFLLPHIVIFIESLF